jgi:hypothetical protein
MPVWIDPAASKLEPISCQTMDSPMAIGPAGELKAVVIMPGATKYTIDAPRTKERGFLVQAAFS